MHFHEQALSFACEGEALVGILSVPERSVERNDECSAERAVLIVVGGPQYRAGSHRQFIQLARALAAQGIASLRFDYRGMGDSGGGVRDFQDVDADLRAAVDQMFAALPDLREVVIWGLCDAASAALFYAAADPRVTGLVLLNPWARTSGGEAKATLKHYYRARLADPAFWRKIRQGRFNVGAASASLFGVLRRALGAPRADAGAGGNGASSAGLGLHERMQAGFAAFRGQVLLIISGADLTAQEFMDMAQGSPRWQAMLAEARVTRQRIDGADHTFSRRQWKDQVADWTGAWLRSW